jgi:hypothetical protein
LKHPGERAIVARLTCQNLEGGRISIMNILYSTARFQGEFGLVTAPEFATPNFDAIYFSRVAEAPSTRITKISKRRISRGLHNFISPILSARCPNTFPHQARANA